MNFDPNNHIVKICAQGMDKEGEGKHDDAAVLFMRAWQEATNDLEKFVAAHYVARHQKTISDKLKWDKVALDFALKVDEKNIKNSFPSLYLNIAKCYEDLNDRVNAENNFFLALQSAENLPDEGYGKMIRSGIEAGIKRIREV